MATTAGNDGKPPYPPFTAETAQIKVKAAQDAWNTKCVSLIINSFYLACPISILLPGNIKSQTRPTTFKLTPDQPETPPR